MSFLIRKIQFELTSEGIEKAIRVVNDIRDKLHPALMNLIFQLAEKGVEIARAELIFFDNPAYYTGELSESITSEVDEDGTGYVLTNCEYAMYVEYGTGDGFDDSNEDGVGRSGKPIHSMTGWYYFNDNDGKVHFTTGMAARPFMHNTYKDLIEEAEASGGKIIAEYLADGGGSV